MNAPTKATRGRGRPAGGDEAKSSARRDLIMKEAARLFTTRGFDATTVRDIASSAGILGGSIYYHFPSKEDIFIAVHQAGMEVITEAVKVAISKHDDPWDQLSAFAEAHAEALLASGELPVIVSPYYSRSLEKVKDKLIGQRDEYDRMIADIVDRLDLPDNIDRTVFRLHFLGALNWMPTWYREKKGKTPAELAHVLVDMVRR